MGFPQKMPACATPNNKRALCSRHRQGFIQRLIDRQAQFLVLTNNPRYTPADLAHRLGTMGLQVPSERIFSSAMATARFLKSQKPGGTAFVLGESGLTSAIHGIGYVITDLNPDYVVLGQIQVLSFCGLFKRFFIAI